MPPALSWYIQLSVCFNIRILFWIIPWIVLKFWAENQQIKEWMFCHFFSIIQSRGGGIITRMHASKNWRIEVLGENDPVLQILSKLVICLPKIKTKPMVFACSKVLKSVIVLFRNTETKENTFSISLLCAEKWGNNSSAYKGKILGGGV